MKAKRLCSLVLAGVILAGGMAGCSGSSTSENSQSASEAAGNTPVTLNIAWWGSQTRNDYTQKLLNTYHKKHPNINFSATPSGYDGYEQKLSTEAAGNALPDIMQMDITFIGEFAKNDSISDLKQYVTDKTIDLTNVEQSIADSADINGKLVGIPLGENAPSMVYSPDVLKKAGIAEPTDKWTWDDFVNDCITIKQKTDNFGYGKTYIESEGYVIFNYFLRQYNQMLFADGGTKLGYQDDRYFVDFVNIFEELQKAKAEPTIDQFTQIDARGKEQSLVAQNKAGFMFEWSNYPTIVESTNSKLKLVAMPNNSQTVKAMYLMPSQFFSISNNSKYKKEAAEFINWFINDLDANKVINCERGAPVSSKIREAMKDSLNDSNKRMFDYFNSVGKISSKMSSPNPSGASEVEKDLNDEIDAVLYGKKTAKQAAADFRKEANEVLSRNS